MFNWLKKKKDFPLITIPDGWIVIEMGQNVVTHKWHCRMVCIADKNRQVWSEDNDTYWNALAACMLGVHKREATMDDVLKQLGN